MQNLPVKTITIVTINSEYKKVNHRKKTANGTCPLFTIETNIRYFIKSATSGEIIFDRTCDLVLDLQVKYSGNSALASLISLAASTISTATTDHIVAARKANYYIFRDIPRGKYSPQFGLDMDVAAEDAYVKARIQ